MNKVIKKSLTAALLSVFVFSLGFSSAPIIPSIPAVPVAHAAVCTIGAIGTAIDNQSNDIIPSVGETITYTLSGTISNISDPTTVTVDDALSADLTFVSSTASVGMYSSSTGVWDLGTMSSSTSTPVNLQISATVNTGTEGEIIDSEPTINYSQSVDSGCAQSAAINAWSMTVQGTPVPPSADLAVTKNVDVTTTTPGSTVHYTVVVKDNGPATSTGAFATDVLPSGLIFQNATASVGSYATSTGTWTIGDLSPSSTATLVYAAEVDPSIIATTTIVNTVSVSESASTTDPVVGNNTASVGFLVVPNATTTPTSTPSADIAITKTANVTSTVPGGTIDYTITVANLSSSTTSTDVVATDTLPTGLTFENATASASTSFASSTGTWTIGDLSPSSTATLQIAALVNASGTAGMTITNTAIVSASTTDNNLGNNSSSVSVFVQGTSTAPLADIGIVKTVDNANPVVGNTINYTLTATAYGPATSTDVVATDTLPSGLTFISATSSEGSYASSTGTWTIGDMSASSSATLQIAATVNSGTEDDVITNTALIGESASTTDNNLANNSSSVSVTVQGGGGGCTSSCGGGGTPSADIAITKTANVTSTVPGGTIDYTISVANLSSSTTSTDVVATDTLPTGLTFENATASASTSFASSTGTWTIGDLSPSSTATLQIAALVNASGTAGMTITNTAIVSASTTDNNLGNNSSSVSVVIGSSVPSTDADLSIVKTVDDATPAAGATVNFTVVVTDNGPATGTQIEANDLLPAGLAYISATTSQGLYDMTTGDWNVGTLAPNATATLLMAAEVDPNGAGNTITNTATVTTTLASLVDPDLSNNSSSVMLTVQSTGCTSNCGGGGGGGGGSAYDNIGIVKTVDNSTPAAGDTINYTLTVNDVGPISTNNVVANDVLPSGLTFVSATSSEGSYASSTGVWTIGTLNIGQTVTLTIAATVNSGEAGDAITNIATVSQTPDIIDSVPGNNSSSATINVSGGGGGGGGGGTPGGGGGGQVLGASTSTGQVLGASCGLYIDQYIHPIRKDLNDPTEVEKLQTFLNQNLGSNLPITGYYGPMTIAAVNQFQVKYHIEVLKPWLPLGLPTEFTPTSYVYQTTQRWINLIMCPPLNLPMPALKVDTGE